MDEFLCHLYSLDCISPPKHANHIARLFLVIDTSLALRIDQHYSRTAGPLRIQDKMAGTILHRIISRPKMAPLQTDRSTHTTPQTNSTDMVKSMQQRISFEEPTERKSSTASEISVPSLQNMRKHSYASVREESDLPQTFHLRRPSSESGLPIDYLPRRLESVRNLQKLAQEANDEEAIFDSDSDITPYSYDGTNSDFEDDEEEEVLEKKPTSIGDLPDEVLDQIFSMIQLDTTEDNYLRPKVDLFACLLVSKAVHEAALRVLYKHVLIYRSKTFHKLVGSVEEDPALGRLIRTLDFSHYSHMGYGRSRGQTNTTPYLTKENLKLVLQQTTGLKNFLVHEHLDDELDRAVLSTLFSIPSLRAVDFTSCTSTPFVDAFSSVWFNSSAPQYSQIKRLCLHECTTLKPAVFENLLPRLTQLTHLDLAHTKVNDKALMSIAPTARITHLNLERCTQITGDVVVNFITGHPAVKDSLVWLNLNADASRYRLLSSDDLDRLLTALPHALKSLNIGGSRISAQHVPALQILATQVEELGLKGANLSLGSDIVQILSLIGEDKKPEDARMKSAVRYIDLTDISSVTQMSLNYSPVSIKDKSSLPLEVIELSGTVLTEIARRNKNVKNPEWTVKELGRRGWYVRAPESFPTDTTQDDGRRGWKMGSRWWGMRKIPMVEQEVGGMYGYFMFKRN